MIPLVLDLDGTLVAGDTLIECALRTLAARPFALLRALPFALSGRAAFKRRMAEAARLDPASLAYNPEVAHLALQARAEGRCVHLATAADALVAGAVAAHLGGFDSVLSSDGETNLKGTAKADVLAARFGEGGFDYAGDSAADTPVWARARRAYVVSPSATLLGAARTVCADVRILGVRRSGLARLRLLSRALRLHQWAKNLLVFVPVLAAHRADVALAQACLAFLAFGLCASSVYLLNDLLDLPHDRLHATKRRRPFASGALNPAAAPKLMAGLLGLTLVCTALLPSAFLGMLGLYYATTLAYSLVLKRHAVWDVVTLAGLYTLRIFAGAAATAIPISPWLLAFSLFLFFCLAVVKRLTELTLFVRAGSGEAGPAERSINVGLAEQSVEAGLANRSVEAGPAERSIEAGLAGRSINDGSVEHLIKNGPAERPIKGGSADRLIEGGPAGRGYAPEDLDMLRSMATSSGYMAVLVLALYVNSSEVTPLYRQPSALWALCPILLFWVSRVLMLSNRGLMNDDPVVFALRDRVSLLAGLASLVAIVVAT